VLDAAVDWLARRAEAPALAPGAPSRSN
jgi:hypothetical protein